MSQTAENTEARILSRVIRPRRGDMSPSAARAILQFQFGAKDQQRMHQLALKNQQGHLNQSEQTELDGYCHVGLLLDLMRSKARRSLAARKEGRSS